MKELFTLKKSKTSVGRFLILGISWFLLLISCIFLIYTFKDYKYSEFLLALSLLIVFYCLYIIFYKKSWINAVAKFIFIILLSLYIFIVISFPLYIFRESSITPLELITPLLLIVLMIIYLYWKQLVLFFKEISTLKKENKKLYFVIMMISIVVIYALYNWFRIYRNLYILDMIALDWNVDPAELDHVTAYSFVFKKIALFAGIVFSSTFLILKSLEERK